MSRLLRPSTSNGGFVAVATTCLVATGPSPRPVRDPLTYSMLEPLAGVRRILRAMVELRDVLGLAIDITVLNLLEGGDSYGDVAAILGLSRQAVAARYRGMSGRRPGGQPHHTR